MANKPFYLPVYRTDYRGRQQVQTSFWWETTQTVQILRRPDGKIVKRLRTRRLSCTEEEFWKQRTVKYY